MPSSLGAGATILWTLQFLIEAVLLKIVEFQVSAHIMRLSVADVRHLDFVVADKFLDLVLQFTYLLLQILDMLILSRTRLLVSSRIPLHTTLAFDFPYSFLKLHLLYLLLLPHDLELSPLPPNLLAKLDLLQLKLILVLNLKLLELLHVLAIQFLVLSVQLLQLLAHQ